ncbi:unnamed protein product [Dovyalis caffra]|uniref:Uncharacterized protein n=1 Tax=Dovyalis caffra TaxID=77055 RepID=A0AAV1QTS6_9ROSI|nr:unnamed protein product [Dovyalis caffra]
MYRSASSSRASSHEFLVNLAPASDVSSLTATAFTELPTYGPISVVTKKDLALHHKSMGEKAIHLIPVVLVICALTLWIFSYPDKL